MDDYFQGEAGTAFSLTAASNIWRANDSGFLVELGFNLSEINAYKKLAAEYLREPGLDHFSNLFPSSFEESALKTLADQVPHVSSFFKDFKKAAIEESVAVLEKYV